jgi:hypothetical protein
LSAWQRLSLALEECTEQSSFPDLALFVALVWKELPMKPSRQAKPDETSSSPTGGRPGKPDQPIPEVTRTPAGDTTASFRPAAPAPAEPETSDEEYILTREDDGRYRITGRRPRARNTERTNDD